MIKSFSKQLIKHIVLSICVSVCSFVSLTSYAEQNNKTFSKSSLYTLNEFIIESVNTYSELKIASLNINKLAYEVDIVSASLGWVATSQGGYSRDASSLGIQSDNVNFGVGLEKPLESGDTFSITANYRHSDSETIVFPLTPNPSDTTNLDINYRIPLLEGSSNQQYLFETKKALIEKSISELEKQQVKENLILKLIDVYYLVATIDSRIETAKKSLLRTNKLRKHIRSNIDLGLLEKGDVLQIDSQLLSLKLELNKIQDIREKQIIAINRFLNKPYLAEFNIPLSDLHKNYELSEIDDVISNVKKHDYEIEKFKAQIKLLDSSLTLSRDREKSKLDLILSMGVQNRSGNSGSNSIDDTDTTGMVKFEYRNALDKRVFSSKRLQLQIDKQAMNEKVDSLSKDIEYDAFKQYSQVSKSQKIVVLAAKKLRNETLKHKDILKRFKNGRSTTNIVIQFDNERIRSELEYQTERYELAKRIDVLLLKQGLFHNQLNSVEKNR